MPERGKADSNRDCGKAYTVVVLRLFHFDILNRRGETRYTASVVHKKANAIIWEYAGVVNRISKG